MQRRSSLKLGANEIIKKDLDVGRLLLQQKDKKTLTKRIQMQSIDSIDQSSAVIIWVIVG